MIAVAVGRAACGFVVGAAVWTVVAVLLIVGGAIVGGAGLAKLIFPREP